MNEFLKRTIREAGGIAKEYFDKGVKASAKRHVGDLLTEADIAVSNFLVGAIQKQFPDHQIHSEEMKEDINPGAEYEWVIDPIDGTRNFAMGIPMWCQLVAVLKNGEPYLNAVYNPIVDELFLAEKGKGAELNGEKIMVNGVDSLDHSFGIVIRHYESTHMDRYRDFLCKLTNDTTVWMHNYGTMIGAAFVASGGADFFVTNSGLDHDNLPIALLCEEAGAKVTDSDGNPWKRGRRDIVIANPVLHSKIMELLR